LHVQGFSTWAPANIGPYSQANKLYPESHQWIVLAGNIGMTPGLMALNGSIEVQFDQIIRSFSRVITEVLGGEAKIPAYARGNVIQHTCLKAILYISKTTVISDELV